MLAPGTGAQVLDDLRLDLRAFRAFEEASHWPGAQAVVGRSSFHLMSVLQLFGMCEDSAWELREPLRSWLEDATHKNVSSLLCEDGFHFQKASVERGSNNKCREQRAFGKLLEQEVMSSSHAFKEVEPVVTSAGRTDMLDASAFRPSLKGTKLEDMKRIVGTTTNARPFWYSPGVESLCVEHADLPLMRWCHKHGRIAEVGNAWLSVLLKSEHRILVRTVVDGRAAKWVMPLVDATGSCTFVWPMRQLNVPGRPQVYYVFDNPPDDINELFMALVDLDMVEAAPFAWRSPLWVAKSYPTIAPSSWPSLGVAAFPTGPVEPLIKVACRQSFWALGLATVSMFANHLEVELPANKTLFDTLMRLIASVLGFEENDALLVLSRRLGNADMDCMTGLLELDEAYDILDHDERQAIDTAKLQHASAKGEAADFKRAWCEKRALVVAPAPKACAKKDKGRGSGKGRGKGQVPLGALPVGDLDQATLKALCLGGGFI